MNEQDKRKLLAAASIGVYAGVFIIGEACKRAISNRKLRNARIKQIQAVREAAIQRLQTIANDPNKTGADIMKAASEEVKFLDIMSNQPL